MAPPRPLAVTGDYAPAVLYAASRWHADTTERVVYQHLRAYALLGVVDGAHTLRLGRRTWQLTQGDLAILPPDRPWVHQVARRARLLYAVVVATPVPLEVRGGGNTLGIAPDQPPQPPPETVWGVSLPVVQPEAVAEPSLVDLRAVCDLWWRDDLHRMRANHLVGTILLRAVQAASAPAPSPSPAAPTDDPWVAKALAGLEGIPPPSSAAVWAAAVGLHRNRFGDRFRAAMGMPPATYLRQLRIRRAEEMLLAGHHPLEMIAIESGFRDTRALGHAFAAAHGCSPLVWRRRHQGGT